MHFALSSTPMKTPRKSGPLSVLLILTLASLPAASAQIIHEGFNYTTGVNTAAATNQSTQTGVAATGTGLVGNWQMNRGSATGNLNGSSFADTTPFSYSNLPSSPTYLRVTGQGSSSSASYLNADLSGGAIASLSAPGSGTTTLWMSYLFNPGTNTASGVYLGRSTAVGDASGTLTGSNSSVGFGMDSSRRALIGGNNATRATSAAAVFTLNTDYWVVASFDLTSAGQITAASMWVKPTSGTVPANEASLGAADATFSGSFAYNIPGKLGFTTGSSAAAFEFDEIRIGANYASVIPEPSSVALLACGLVAAGLAFVSKRRRS